MRRGPRTTQSLRPPGAGASTGGARLAHDAGGQGTVLPQPLSGPSMLAACWRGRHLLQLPPPPTAPLAAPSQAAHAGSSCWRTRRWANEQAKAWDPEQTRRSLDGDAWDDALEMLGACGPVSRAHLATTVSTENELATPRPISPRGSDLSACMLGESRPEVPASLGTALLGVASPMYVPLSQLWAGLGLRWDSTLPCALR